MSDINDPNDLTFHILRRANCYRLGGDKRGCLDWTPTDWMTALVGEVGELANWQKKLKRGDITEDHFLIEARKEIADIVTYLDLYAQNIGLDLGACTVTKFNIVSERVGSKVFIEHNEVVFK